MKHVSIEVIKKCPNECIHCSSESDKLSEIVMDVELVKKVFDGLGEGYLNVQEVSISGGEPFLHKDIVDIIRYGKNKGFKINIYTSGITLDENGEYKALDKKIIENIKDFGVNKLIFNVQSLNERTYDTIMGTVGNLSLLKESIELTKKAGIYTEIHFVPMKLNYKEIYDIVNYVKNENLDRVSFLGLIPHGRAKYNKDRIYLDKETNNKLKEELNKLEGESVRVGTPLKLKKEHCKCDAGIDKLYIKFDGYVYGCEAFKYIDLKDDEGNDVLPESIHDKCIDDIYNNSKYLGIARKEIGEIMKNPIRETCPIQTKLRKGE